MRLEIFFATQPTASPSPIDIKIYEPSLSAELEYLVP
jgi:hypothetical protein